MLKGLMTVISIFLVMTIVFLQIMEPWAFIILALCLGWMMCDEGQEKAKNYDELR